MITIRIRTLQKDQFSVQVPIGATVAQLKQAIKKDKGHEESWQKIIFSGKILSDEKTLESYNVNENDFCVLMLKKPTTTEAPKEQPKPQETPKEEPKPQETPKEQPKPQEQPKEQTTTTQTQPQTQPQQQEEKVDLNKLGEEQIATKKEDVEKLLQQLMEMGFDREQSALALKASFNNLSRAVDYLMSGEIPNVNPFESRSPVNTGGGSRPQTGTGGGNRPTQTQPQTQPQTGTGGGNSPSTSTGGGSSPINLWEEAQGNQGTQGSQGGQQPGVFDFLRGNREFDTLRFLVQQRPEMLQPLLQNIGQVQPQLLQLISQHQEEFTRLLNEPVDPSNLNLPQRPTHNVQLTEEERASLNRLMDLGFDQQSALEAYLTCDKNEELAANYLLEHGGDFMQDEGEGGDFFEGGEGGDDYDEGGDNN